MKVRMRDQLQGTRNGVRWPSPGTVIELPDGEAVDLCSQNVAEPVAEVAARVEKKVAVKPETRKRR